MKTKQSILCSVLPLSLAVFALAVSNPVPAAGAGGVELVLLGSSPAGGELAAEIPAYDPVSKRVFVANGKDNRVDILDISDPTAPKLLEGSVDVSSFGSPTCVAFKNGLGAVVMPADPVTDPGTVVFFNADGEVLGSATVGSLPDMVTFTPDGTKALVANEGEPNDAYDVDPEGSVSIIDVTGDLASVTVTTARFSAWDGTEAALREQGIRIYGPGASVSQDLEPEYIAVSADSRTAWVTLQENNAMGILDLETASFTQLVPLGFKNHMAKRNALDASDKDKKINIANWPVQGMYLPDAIVAYQAGGSTFLVTANEGDSRGYTGFNEEARVADLTLHENLLRRFPDLQDPKNLGRLKVTTSPPSGKLLNQDGEAVYNQLFSYGARSFSIWTTDGALVFDSGNELELTTAAYHNEKLVLFNADENKDAFDSRSDDKGVEPEGVAVGEAFGRTYAFITLERVGGVMAYDVSDPFQPFLVDYANNRQFGTDPAKALGPDLSPEGVIFVRAEDSPNGQPLVVVANTVSGTTTIYELRQN